MKGTAVPTFLRCPECDRRFRLPPSAGATTRCPNCDAKVDTDADIDRRPSRRSSPRGSSGTKILLGVLLGCGGLVILGCVGVGIGIWKYVSPASYPEQTEEYAQARQKFRTKLVRRGPAPQNWKLEPPPFGAKEMEYTSGGLRLRAWVSSAPPAGVRRPAVLFLHGGFAFGADDWQQTQPYRDAGFVVMTPTLRGENGLPGSFSMFYDEVDDVLAAAEALARLPYVDANRLYISGHSVGGTLTMLAAMASNRFRAAASFSGSPDQIAWTRGNSSIVPFDTSDPREYHLRSPMAFPRSFQCPVRVYYGEQEIFFSSASQKLAQLAKKAGRDVEAISVPGDHGSMVDPAMHQAIAFFLQH